MENLSAHASVSLHSARKLLKAALPTETCSTNYTESKNQVGTFDSSDQKSYCLNDNLHTNTNENDFLTQQGNGCHIDFDINPVYQLELEENNAIQVQEIQELKIVEFKTVQ